LNTKTALSIGVTIIAVVIGIFFVLGFIQEQELQSYQCRPTPDNPQGPYYIAEAPFKEIFGESLEGERFHLTGKVLNQDCQPIPGAVLDFWHTDSFGNYDHEGYTLRGRIQTNQNGEYFLDTVFPEKYGEFGFMRPRHIHLKVHAPDEPTLTTQLYFENDSDRDIFVKDGLILKLSESDGLKKSSFDFVIRTKG